MLRGFTYLVHMQQNVLVQGTQSSKYLIIKHAIF